MDLDPHHIKAYFRRAAAHKQVGFEKFIGVKRRVTIIPHSRVPIELADFPMNTFHTSEDTVVQDTKVERVQEAYQ